MVILDVFSKKTAQTPADTLTICRKRLYMYLRVVSGKERSGS